MTTASEPDVGDDVQTDSATPDIHTTAGKLSELRRRLDEARAPMGQAAIDKTHEMGLMTARERIENLLDPGSFVEIDALARHRATTFGLAERRPQIGRAHV